MLSQVTYQNIFRDKCSEYIFKKYKKQPYFKNKIVIHVGPNS